MSPDGWAFLTLTLYALVGVGIVLWQTSRCEAGWQFWMLHLLARVWTNTIFGQRITHRCPFPHEGGGLLVVNHRSPVDPMFVLSASGFKREGFKVRVMEFMTAREYCEMGGPIGWLCGVMQSIPVDRDGQDIGPAKQALRRLRDGKLVGIFPEGRLNTGEGLLPFSPGVAWLALRSGVPVFPVFIHDAPQKGSMITPFYTICDTDISFGDAIDLSEYEGIKPTPQILQEVAALLRQRVGELGGLELDEEPSPATVQMGDAPSRGIAG